MTEKDVYLSYKNEQTTDSTLDMLACVSCRNKTFTARTLPGFPELYCAACGLAIGKFGWARDETDD